MLRIRFSLTLKIPLLWEGLGEGHSYESIPKKRSLAG
jgi:hypothetical protein